MTDENYPNPTSHVALMPGFNQSLFNICGIQTWYFHSYIYFIFRYEVLVLGQIFAVMPLSGVTSKTAKNLKFKWFDLRTLYTFLVMIGIFIMIMVCFKWTLARMTLTEAPDLGISTYY